MLLVALVATTAFAACGGDDDGTTGGSGTDISSLKVTKTSLTFTKDGGTETVNVQAPQQVSATSDASWLTVTAGTMSGNLKVTPLTITVGAMTTETTDRTATITVKAGSETAAISVTQKAGDILTVSQTDYDVPAEGGTVVVRVTSNGDYKAVSSASWLTVGTKGNGEHSFAAVANSAGARTATITFTLNQETAVVNIHQAAGQQGVITAKAMDIARLMYPAWNLGNTMEGGNNAHLWTNNGGLSAETSWQSTKTTQAIIQFVHSQGFRAIRIPTAWVMGHITDKDKVTIDPVWLNRVKEIVDYCVSDGLYVLLNDHWDGGWLENSFGDISAATVAANSDKLKKLWTQIADAFKDYDEHLLFAGLNEPGMNGPNFTAATTTALLQYEQAFIDAVRSTGGNNDKRTLVVQGPFTDIDQTCSASNNYSLTRLNDPAGAGYLMVEIHCYTPWVFCGMEKDESWGKVRYYWGTGNGSGERYYANGEQELKNQFQKMKTNFADKGYPVIVGEAGANYRFSTDASHNASIKAWYKTIAEQSVSNGCIPFYWDTNYTGFPNMTIISRATLQVNNPYMMEGINEGVAVAKWPY